MKRKPKNYWTFEKILEEALKHNYRIDFSKSSYQAYDKARVNGWLDIVCSHMEYKTKPKNYWGYTQCKEEALKYSRKVDFQKSCQVAYNKALKNMWLDEICNHMLEIKKPNRYWTLENCKEEALKYKRIKDFSKNASKAYKVSCENGWIEEVTSHMNRPTIWSYEKCKLVTLKYNFLSDFRKQESGCYCFIHKNGWIDLLCSHMERKCNKNGYLNKEICREEAKKYKNRKEFRENCPNIYHFISKNKWIEELCGHQECAKNNGFWNKERCHEKALECKTNTEFKNKYPSAYASALKNKWLCDIRGHFEIQGNLRKRFVYAYEFPDNHVYVGLTCNIEKRKDDHLLKGAVFNYSTESNLEPIFKQISPLPIEVEEARKQEGHYLNEYINNGWIPLNKAKTGAIGKTTVKWTTEKLQQEALKYTTKKEFRENSESAYATAKRHKIINDICKHMNCKESKGNNYWTYENCKNEALKYNSKKEFYTNSSSAYNASRKNGWLEKIYTDLKL